MKKVFTLVAVASMFTFVACGPSAEEQAKLDEAKAEAKKDSIFEAASHLVETAVDSAAATTTETAPAAEEKKH